MPATHTSAPGKLILFGEHAVVYGQPAIAVPVPQVRATATVEDRPTTDGITLYLPDLAETLQLERAAPALLPDHPLERAVRLVQHHLRHPLLPPLRLTLHSAIPIAGGLGSGAALAAALIRALLRHLGTAGDDATVCGLTWEVEKMYHGTPSGIDNTVVAYEQPVWFVRATPENVIEPFGIGRNLTFLIGDTGVRSATRAVVDDVRRQWQADPDRFGVLFAQCGTLAHAARAALQTGDAVALGHLMCHNHTLLQALTVSSPELDRLVQAALAAGASGAKLSGAGRGGNMLALLPHPESAESVTRALLTAGARTVLTTTLIPTT